MGDPTDTGHLPSTVLLRRILSRVGKLERQLRGAGRKQQLAYTYAGVGAFSDTVRSRPVSVNWMMPFSDTSYTVIPDLAQPAGSTAVVGFHVSDKTVNRCTVTIITGGATIPSGSVLTVEGIHL